MGRQLKVQAFLNSPTPRVLVTGGAGFIGSHTCDALIREGYRVRILDCLDQQIHGRNAVFPSYLHPDIERIRGDIRHPRDVRRALKDISYVFHFAALTGVGQSSYNLKNYTDVNLSGTANLIEMIVKHKYPVKKFILASSRAAYGEGTHECPDCGIIYPPIRNQSDMEQGRFDVSCPKCGHFASSVATSEDRPLTPISIYGWTKKSQEDLCQYASKALGLPTIIFRYFNVYGSRQSLINPYTGIVSIFFNRLMADKALSIYEHGFPLRDFVHVSDVVQANLKALNLDLPPGTAINIGAGIGATISDIGRAIARATGKKLQFEDRGEFRVGDVHAVVADLKLAKKYLGFEPKITLEEGMQEFVSWAQNQPKADLYQKTVEELKAFGLFSQTRSKLNS